MRKDCSYLDEFRVKHNGVIFPGEPIGCFRFSGMKVIVSVEDGWEHASVEKWDGCPSWGEMEFVKAVIWLPEEIVMQYHLPGIEVPTHCLHLWREVNGEPRKLPPQPLTTLQCSGSSREHKRVRRSGRTDS